MMDISSANALADPYGGAQQPAYPWRGRITCHPAPGQPGTVDRTSAARNQLETYAGGAQGYRRFILHYAQLAASAGGVDGFLVGSELRGLTQIRDDSGMFPFVETLIALATDVKALLPQAKITYGADWSEYFGYQPSDGSGDVYFHLDPLWASPAIDAVGIDNYMPLSDWRDQDLASANPDGFRLADDRKAMMAAINAGEGFDWYYADDAARVARQRSPITDGLAGKPWVFRYKDIASWWANPHFERVGGVERATPTAWVPSGKPVWFTELGCGAVEKGANQPNVFADPKSVESGAPYFSNGMRADSMQRRYLEAHHDWWAGGGTAPQGMVDAGHLFVWSWDARPYPAFPQDKGLWSDGGNWRTGHWLNGRLGGGTLADVIAAVLRDHAFADFDVSEVSGDLTGYVQGDLTSARSLIEPLLQACQVDVFEDAGLLRFRSRGRSSRPARTVETLVDLDDEPLWQETRGHDSDFAAEAVLTFYNPALDYEQASVRSHRVAGTTSRVIKQDLAAVMPEETALAMAEALLRDNRIARRSIRFSLPPGKLGVQPGDVVSIAEGPAGRFLILRIEDGNARRIEAREFAPSSGGIPRTATDERDGSGTASALFAPVVHLIDLPRFESGDATIFARAAVFARPWRTVGLSSSATTEGYRGRVLLDRPARNGTLAAGLGSGVTGRFDWSTSLIVDLAYGELSSAPEISVLNGANRLAVRSTNGVWEVLSFLRAEEIETGRWRVSGLLRALSGTEDAMVAGAQTGSPVVVLDDAVKPLGLRSDEMGLSLNWIAETASSLETAGPFVFAGGVRAQTPLSPVRLRGLRNAAGDAAVVWTRRGRDNADSWIGADIPLDEPFERYRIEVLGGDRVVRAVEVEQPQWVYALADETADFGGRQSSLSVRIRQLGERVPLGLAAEATFAL
jgi:hypothetical protein